MCWVKEGCSSLQPKACSSLPLEVVDYGDEFDTKKLNLYLNTGCYTGDPKRLQAQLDNAPASCNPPCFRITKPGEYCYMSTRNNNFSNRRHMGQITVTEPPEVTKHGFLGDQRLKNFRDRMKTEKLSLCLGLLTSAGDRKCNNQ